MGVFVGLTLFLLAVGAFALVGSSHGASGQGTIVLHVVTTPPAVRLRAGQQRALPFAAGTTVVCAGRRGVRASAVVPPPPARASTIGRVAFARGRGSASLELQLAPSGRVVARCSAG